MNKPSKGTLCENLVAKDTQPRAIFEKNELSENNRKHLLISDNRFIEHEQENLVVHTKSERSVFVLHILSGQMLDIKQMLLSLLSLLWFFFLMYL